MKVLLLQLDGKLPNLALMRIAAHHRDRGDEVELRRTGNPNIQLFDAPFDEVYASLIFEDSRPLAAAVKQVYPKAKIGGPGWWTHATIESVGIASDTPPDYSHYPRYENSIGYTQRGCRFRCGFCKVPIMEPELLEVASIAEIWRGDPHPRHLHLLDNDFFGQPNWRDRIDEIRTGRFKVCFNQGVNVRMLNDETAAAVASVRYYDDQFQTRRFYTAWDNQKDEHRLFAGLNALVKHGLKPYQIMVYMIIGYWPGETFKDREYRRARLREFGSLPYPMPFIRTRELVGFQRWVIGGYDRRGVSWQAWESAGYQPSRLGFPAEPRLEQVRL